MKFLSCSNIQTYQTNSSIFQYTSTPKDELEERSLPEEEENPYQLIYQYSGEEEEEDAFYQYTNDEVEEDAPFSYVQGATQGGPALSSTRWPNLRLWCTSQTN